jgi:alkylation response protein AidB-like acyl-CoA dehydrogenase
MYKAPVRELQFVLHRLVEDGQLSSLPSFADYSTDLADSVLEEAARFAGEVLDPINRVGDVEGAQWTPDGVRMPQAFRDAYAAFAEGGWTQMRAPVEEGGQGAPLVLSAAVEEMWASANLAFKLCPMLTQSAIEALHLCGSDEQKRLYLPKMVTGEWTGTMNLTEPHAGSDLGLIRTRAVREGDHYRLFGQKIFITYGEHDYTPNIIHAVLARVDGAPPGTKGISLFIVPKVLVNADGSLGARNDVRCVSIEHKLGIHASPTCVMAYGDREGAIGYLVGEENRGLEYMFIMMNAARLSVGVDGYALGERAYQKALEWAQTRVQGRPRGNPKLPIMHHPDIKRMLLTMKAYTEAARAVALYAALQLDIAKHHPDAERRARAQARGDLMIPIVKAWSTDLGVTIASLGIQVHGGMGFVEETGAAQLLRDARIGTIYEGTNGIQAGDLVGRKIGRDNGSAMGALIDDMMADLKLPATQQALPADMLRAVLDAIDSLRESAQSVCNFLRDEPERAQAVAVPYLTQCGVTIGAWLMAKSHALAVQDRAQDPEFFAAKRLTTRFYVELALPEAMALAKVVESGARSVVEADPEQVFRV